MPLDSFDRRSSKWDEEPKGTSISRIVLQRFWILIVPLIAVAWYNTRVIVPMGASIEQKLADDKKQAEERRSKILSDARRVGVQTSLLRALADTLDVRFKKYDSLIDSVSTLRKADETELATINRQANSLRTIYSRASGRADTLSAMLPPMQVRIDTLKTVITKRDEQIRRLEAEKQADLDLTERVLRPNQFRKNTALLTGPGSYPNRDTIPKR